MSPPLLVVEGSGQSNDPLLPSPTYEESVLKEHNYLGLSDCSSVDSSTVTGLNFSKDNLKLNLKATELRLGLPGSQSPERGSESDQLCLMSSSWNPLFPVTPMKDGVSSSLQMATVITGSKRGFSDAMDKLPMLSSSRPGTQDSPKTSRELPQTNGNGNAKAQVVGWPPIPSFRKNTLATTSKNNDPLFVKVSMDGAPYLRKVDLRSYTTYQELSSGLEKMFSCFTLGQCGSHGGGGESMSETKLKDLLHGSEYVLTYEDKDGDWMLVGDVPWEMFIESCKRLKIMKSCDAIGLAPRVMEKFKIRN